MKFERTVNLGNVISWMVLLVGFVAGYSRLEGDVGRNKEDITQIKSEYVAIQKQLQGLDKNTAVIGAQMEEINKRLDVYMKRL